MPGRVRLDAAGGRTPLRGWGDLSERRALCPQWGQGGLRGMSFWCFRADFLLYLEELALKVSGLNLRNSGFYLRKGWGEAGHKHRARGLKALEKHLAASKSLRDGAPRPSA